MEKVGDVLSTMRRDHAALGESILKLEKFVHADATATVLSAVRKIRAEQAADGNDASPDVIVTEKSMDLNSEALTLKISANFLVLSRLSVDCDGDVVEEDNVDVGSRSLLGIVLDISDVADAVEDFVDGDDARVKKMMADIREALEYAFERHIYLNIVKKIGLDIPAAGGDAVYLDRLPKELEFARKICSEATISTGSLDAQEMNTGLTVVSEDVFFHFMFRPEKAKVEKAQGGAGRPAKRART